MTDEQNLKGVTKQMKVTEPFQFPAGGADCVEQFESVEQALRWCGQRIARDLLEYQGNARVLA